MERDKVLDATKYILIVLVVLGHFIEPSRYTNSFTCTLYCIIYSFHMPLFIMISGYLYKQRSIALELKKCIPLLEACLITHIGFVLIRKGIDLSIKDLLIFGGPAWFLLCLIYWRIGTNFLLKYLTDWQILGISLFFDLLVFCFFQHGGYLSIGRAVGFYPFFILGYCLKGRLKGIISTYRDTFIILGASAVIYVILTASILQFKTEFHTECLLDLKRYTDIETYLIFLNRYGLLFCALCISAFVLVLVTNSTVIQKLAIYGTNTLFIYYIQTFIFAVIGLYEITLWQSLVLVCLTIPTLTYMAQRPFAKYMINPICEIMNFCNKKP
ncbi:MAG: acyltransferase family protein [Paludibacteraceae bacterium]|nr:acyltransferase family protein [Paludibacteraceae bacterium]